MIHAGKRDVLLKIGHVSQVESSLLNIQHFGRMEALKRLSVALV